MKIDLNTCVAGQKLKSKHGLVLTYIGKTPVGNYYDHYIEYPNGSRGTRMNDGFTYKNPERRLEQDHDIVEILPLDITQ